MKNNTYTHVALDKRNYMIMFKGSKSEVQDYLYKLSQSAKWDDDHDRWFNTFIYTKEEAERFRK
jgi:hypothetical protein